MIINKLESLKFRFKIMRVIRVSITKAVKFSRRNFLICPLVLPNVSILSWDCFNEKLIGSFWWVHVKQTFSIKSWVFQAWFMSSSYVIWLSWFFNGSFANLPWRDELQQLSDETFRQRCDFLFNTAWVMIVATVVVKIKRTVWDNISTGSCEQDQQCSILGKMVFHFLVHLCSQVTLSCLCFLYLY